MTDVAEPPLLDASELDGSIEPRLRARRVEVRRAERRRRRRLWTIAVALVAAIGLSVLALYSPLLDVGHLDIEGLGHLEPTDVVAAAGISDGQRMVDLDTERAERAIAALPWVQRVTVTRRWPDTVEVRIVEREGIARLATAGAATPGPPRVVTTDGLVAGEAGPLDDALPLLSVDPAVTATIGRRLAADVVASVQMVGALPSSLRSRTEGATMSATGSVELQLRGGATLVLGDGSDVAAKFLAAESIFGGAVILDCLERADVSVPSATVITRDPSCR